MTIDEIPDTPLVSAWRRDDDYGGCHQVCSEINQALLFQSEDVPQNIGALITQFDEFFQYNSRSSGTTLYRACTMHSIIDALDNGTMVYPAFIPTSASILHAASFYRRIATEDNPVFLHLILDEDIPVIDANSRIYGGVEEEEFVLPRGLRLSFEQTLDNGHHQFLVSSS